MTCPCLGLVFATVGYTDSTEILYIFACERLASDNFLYLYRSLICDLFLYFSVISTSPSLGQRRPIVPFAVVLYIGLNLFCPVFNPSS